MVELCSWLLTEWVLYLAPGGFQFLAFSLSDQLSILSEVAPACWIARYDFRIHAIWFHCCYRSFSKLVSGFVILSLFQIAFMTLWKGFLSDQTSIQIQVHLCLTHLANCCLVKHGSTCDNSGDRYYSGYNYHQLQLLRSLSSVVVFWAELDHQLQRQNWLRVACLWSCYQL